MAEIRRSNSPVFDVDDDQSDFTLNLSQQLAMIDNDVLMDDVVVIENSDNELEKSVDSTINAMSMILTFPMLTLGDTSTNNSDLEIGNPVGGFESTPSISSQKPAQEEKVKSKRRGRPPRVQCQPSSQSKMLLRPINIKATNAKATVNSRKAEGFRCKLNGTWYQITTRDLDVILAIEHTFQEIRAKMRKTSNLNARTLSLDLQNVETALGILDDDRLDLGMPRETWQELLLFTKNNFLEVQLEVENVKRNLLKTELQKPPPKTRQRLISQMEERNPSNNNKSFTPSKGLAFEEARNGCNGNLQGPTEIETQQIENINLSQGNPNCFGQQAQVTKSKRSQSKNLRVSKRSIGMSGDSSDVEILELDSSQALEPQTSTQMSDWNDDHAKAVYEAGLLNSISPNAEMVYPDSQAILSQDYSQNLEDDLVMPKPLNARNASSENFANVRGKQLKRPSKKHIQSEKHGSESHLSLKLRERVSKYLKVAKWSFDFSTLIKARCLTPGKTLTICINNQNYNALLKQNSTLESDTGVSFSGIAQWIKSIMGKPYSRLTVKEQRSVEIFYEDVPLEDVLDGVDLEQGCESYKTLDLGSEQEDSPFMRRETFRTPHETSRSDRENLHLVPDEMNRNVKSLIVHTEAEYFPTCKCYEKSWAGKEPFPQHYLDELENW